MANTALNFVTYNQDHSCLAVGMSSTLYLPCFAFLCFLSPNFANDFPPAKARREGSASTTPIRSPRYSAVTMATSPSSRCSSPPPWSPSSSRPAT